jgi:hypothetical protein
MMVEIIEKLQQVSFPEGRQNLRGTNFHGKIIISIQPMAQQHPHLQGFAAFHNIPSGLDATANEFINWYLIGAAPFNFDCAGCCISWLVNQRQYAHQGGQVSRVVFPSVGLPWDGGNLTACFARRPGGAGVKGQLATLHDINLGQLGPRAFASSHTYQMYSPTGNLTIGYAAVVRVESIAIDVLRRPELHHVSVNYVNAVLLEMYRQDGGKPSLTGTIEMPNYEVGQIDDLANKFNKKNTIK